MASLGDVVQQAGNGAGSTRPSTVLVLGNPGVGKSTILNLLVGKPHFKSGVSLNAAGLTTELASTESEGVRYYDVPGLSDPTYHQAAAVHITQALRAAGSNCSIVFVVNATGGRLRPDEMTTIRAILDACSDIRRYGVLINMVPETNFGDQQVHRNLKSMVMQIIDAERRTQDFHFMQWTRQLHDEGSNKVHMASSEVDITALRKFTLETVGRCDVNPQAVREVDPDNFLAMQQKYNDMRVEVAVRTSEQRAVAAETRVQDYEKQVADLKELNASAAQLYEKQVADFKELNLSAAQIFAEKDDAQKRDIQRLEEELRNAEKLAVQMQERAANAVRDRDAAELAQRQEQAARVAAEADKARAEAFRVAAEADRAREEALRVAAEADRVRADTARVAAEAQQARADSASAAALKAKTERDAAVKTGSKVGAVAGVGSAAAACIVLARLTGGRSVALAAVAVGVGTGSAVGAGIFFAKRITFSG